MVVRGALAAGCDFFAGYPITPSSEVYAEMMRQLPGLGGIAVGAPDEISSLSYAVGASLSGAHAMTATSGPGWSLMIETVGYAVMTETPVVILVVQRLGPATGGATQGGQGDLFLVEYCTSGGYPIPVLAPVDAYDCYTLTAEAFSIADRLRSPVVVLSDKEVAMTVESVHLDKLPDVRPAFRSLPSSNSPYRPYGIQALSDVPLFTPVGGSRKVTVTGSAHNQDGQLRKNDPETIRQIQHLDVKISQYAERLERVRWTDEPGARTLLVSFGISARTCRDVARQSKSEGNPVSLLEILSLYPVPWRALKAAAQKVRRVVIVEENLSGLYGKELLPFLRDVEVQKVNQIGAMISPAAIREVVRA